MSIVVNKISHTFSKNSPFERLAINDISFEVEDGSFVGIIGHTGSGKSTLIQHLNGLLKPDSGSIIIDGVDITKSGVNMRDIRAKVGIVFQYPEYQLFEETVYLDIAYGPKNLGYDDARIEQLVNESINFVGLDAELLNKSPFELSGGQKRKVAIAGVLAMNPSVIILDEPTAGLDPAARNDLLKRFKELHKTKNTTIFLVSHSMEDISNTVEKVMIIEDGSLVKFDTVDNIFASPEILKKHGLDIPQTSELMNKLKSSGFDVDSRIYNVEKAAEHLYEYIKGEQNA